MAALIAVALSALAMLLVLVDWRKAVFCVVVLAILLDPLRKLTPGAPAFLELTTALPILAIIFKITFGTNKKRRADFSQLNLSTLKTATFIFAASCVPAALISLTYGPGSWMLTIFGAISYSTLIASIFVGTQFANSEQTLRRLLVLYCLISTVMLGGAFLEYAGFSAGSPLIGTDVFDTDWVKYHGYQQIHLIAGFYRSPDVMGWHAATVVMLSALLFFTSPRKRRWLWIAITLIAAAALLLSGRRKMVFMIPVFVASLSMIFALSGRQKWLSKVPLLLAAPLAFGLVVALWAASDSPLTDYYFGNQDQAAYQISDQGFHGLSATLQQFGFFGGGLGVATPGTQHLDVSRPYVWQESGSSRVLVELGVPGFAFLLLLILVALKAGFDSTVGALRRRDRLAPYPACLLALVVANLSSLFVSGQILADPFVIFFIGFSIGICIGYSSRGKSRPGHTTPAGRAAQRMTGGLWEPASRPIMHKPRA
jgi:hypothetical protein